jgi:hypothetical protein
MVALPSIFNYSVEFMNQLNEKLPIDVTRQVIVHTLIDEGYGEGEPDRGMPRSGTFVTC